MTSVDMTSVLVHSRSVGTAKLVLLGIAFHTGKDRSKGCWPSQLTLAAYAGVSVRQVRRAIDQLVGLGELEIDIRASWKRGDGWYTNLYYLRDLCSDSCHVHHHEVRTSMTEPADIEGHR